MNLHTSPQRKKEASRLWAKLVTKLVTSVTQDQKPLERHLTKVVSHKLGILTISDQSLKQLQFNREEVGHNERPLKTLNL